MPLTDQCRQKLDRRLIAALFPSLDSPLNKTIWYDRLYLGMKNCLDDSSIGLEYIAAKRNIATYLKKNPHHAENFRQFKAALLVDFIEYVKQSCLPSDVLLSASIELALRKDYLNDRVSVSDEQQARKQLSHTFVHHIKQSLLRKRLDIIRQIRNDNQMQLKMPAHIHFLYEKPHCELSPEKSSRMPVMNETFLQDMIETYREYACSDFHRFEAQVAPGKLDWMRQKEKRYLNQLGKVQCESQANLSAQPVNGSYTKTQIEGVAKNVDSVKAACCTTFALSLANKIMQQAPNLNFQILSYDNKMGSHCFVKITDENGENESILDPWLASLGWQGVYKSEDYPWQSMLTDPKVFYDNTASTPQKHCKPA